jgi:hypothetical protein
MAQMKLGTPSWKQSPERRAHLAAGVRAGGPGDGTGGREPRAARTGHSPGGRAVPGAQASATPVP